MSYHRFSVKYGTLFEAKIGAEAIYDLFRNLDLPALKTRLEERYPKAGAAEREKLGKRISLVSNMIAAGTRPEWMFLTRIPVTPPALRPMVALEGGRHATSDLNDLYRRVINRNNRLKKLLDIKAPEVILRNEKRILQEAVDALLDNSIRKSGASGGRAHARPAPSAQVDGRLSQGQAGYFRQNLLGKRVDYSGRSVIVVGPDLELDECGLPKHMALELFRPFVIAGLLERELAFNIRGAGRLIEDGRTGSLGDPRRGDPRQVRAPQPRSDAPSPGHPGLPSAPHRRRTPSSCTRSSVRPSTPTSTATRWPSMCRSPRRRSGKRRTSCRPTRTSSSRATAR